MSLAYLHGESTSRHPDDIWALKWTHTNHIVSGAADGHLRIFDAAEPSAPIHDLAAHPLAVTALSVSHDGRRALSASLDGTLVLSQPREGRILGKLETGREKLEGENEIAAYSCALHPQSSAYAWAGRGNRVVVRSIDSASLQDDTQADQDNAEAKEGEDAGANGHAEGSVGRGPLESGGAVIDTGKGKYGMDLQFSPDGRQIAVSTENGFVTILDAETQSVVANYQSHAMPVRTVSWSHDSQWLYSGSDDTRIVLHDIRAGSGSQAGEGAVAILQGHQSWVLDVAAGPDGKLLGSLGADRNLKLWDIGQRTAVYTTSLAAPAWSFDWQPADVQIGSLGAGKQFAVGGDERSVLLYRQAGSV